MREGRTIVIDQFLNVSFLERVGPPTSRRFLDQSGDNLLAVEMFYLGSSDSAANNPVRYDSSMVGFRIFRLNKEEQMWDEMESLGLQQILFLGLHQAISASASEFYWGKRNLIFYSAGLSIPPRYGFSERYTEDRLVIVFDLETGTASP
ncbi:hypothetical protein CRYUN_Cryun18bG0123500 [Craigia yunnanensis]